MSKINCLKTLYNKLTGQTSSGKSICDVLDEINTKLPSTRGNDKVLGTDSSGNLVFKDASGGGATVVTFTVSGSTLTATHTPTQVETLMKTGALITGIIDYSGTVLGLGSCMSDEGSPAFMPNRSGGEMSYFIDVVDGAWHVNS